mmetsp:Transcript_20442/g.46186  ORF Transcript_20442/g.46186 Transcript_20442/m.46186 type:complete len:303 (+) Transcript_20442:425-1333(+)
MAALKVGADLAFVFTAQEAAIPLKCYGPELMVLSMYSVAEFDLAASSEEREQLVARGVAKVKEALSRVHALLIGPGLGRHPQVMHLVAEVISVAKEMELPLVIDADGLLLVTRRPDLVHGYPNLVLTPNAAEFARLRDAVLLGQSPRNETHRPSDPSASAPSADLAEARAAAVTADLAQVSAALGNVPILLKGAADVTAQGGRLLQVSGEQGSPRRCGGMGDILSGATVVLLTWALRSDQGKGLETAGGELDFPQALWAAWAASILTKRSAAKAFSKHKRSTTAPDVLEELGGVGDEMFPVA